MKRNIILSLSCAAAMLIMLPSFGQGSNKLTKKEKKNGWVLLFNGKDFKGWRQCNGTAMPKNWVIEDGAMKVFTGEGKNPCLLYTSDAADDLTRVDLGGRRIIK